MCCVYAHLLYRGPNIRGIQDHKMGFFWPLQHYGCGLIPPLFIDFIASIELRHSASHTQQRRRICGCHIYGQHKWFPWDKQLFFTSISTPWIIKCPSILRKRWLAETSWFFGWRYLELVVRLAKTWNRDIIEQSPKCSLRNIRVYPDYWWQLNHTVFKRGNTVRYLVWRWLSCLFSQLVKITRFKTIWKSLSRANKETIFPHYPTCEVSDLKTEGLKRKTQVG